VAELYSWLNNEITGREYAHRAVLILRGRRGYAAKDESGHLTRNSRSPIAREWNLVTFINYTFDSPFSYSFSPVVRLPCLFLCT
jgi:hypothetical protein